MNQLERSPVVVARTAFRKDSDGKFTMISGAEALAIRERGQPVKTFCLYCNGPAIAMQQRLPARPVAQFEHVGRAPKNCPAK